MVKARKHLDAFAPYLLPSGTWKGKLRLNMNESHWHCSPKALEVIRNFDPADLSNYPQYGELVEKIAVHHGVGTDQVVAGNGADDVITLIMEAFIEPGDEIVAQCPTYPMFPIMGRLKQGKIIDVPYGLDLKFPVERMLDVINDKTRMVTVVNPANPAGTSISRQDLIRIFEKAKNSILILDEAYSQYAGITHIDLLSKFPNLIVIYSFAKVYGMAGLRLGYAVSHRQNIEALQKVVLPLAVNSLAVKAGIQAIQDQDFVKKVVAEIRSEKEFLIAEAEKIGLETVRSDTNFLLFKFGKHCLTMLAELENRNILVRNTCKFPELKDYLRVTIGRRNENMQFIKAVAEIMKKL
ncbi:MAG: histidinol-phosphate transaminase [Candidatus Wallbacteria bacterium]|nr:histidinol-phosphate transaminase [Candidatus Wallbacteria bacterium]